MKPSLPAVQEWTAMQESGATRAFKKDPQIHLSHPAIKHKFVLFWWSIVTLRDSLAHSIVWLTWDLLGVPRYQHAGQSFAGPKGPSVNG